MTRINLVPPSELCDQHLLAEHRARIAERMHKNQRFTPYKEQN